MKKIYTFILLCLCVFVMTACKNNEDGASNSSPIESSQPMQEAQSGGAEEEETATNSGGNVGNSENSDLGGHWTGIHSK